MRNIEFKKILSVVTLFGLLLTANSIANAAPVKLSQVVQQVSARPLGARTANNTQIRFADNNTVVTDDDAPQDDDKSRVWTQEKTEIVNGDDCECAEVINTPTRGRFPWAVLGVAAAVAIPAAILLTRDKKTPTPSPNATITPTETPTVTPTMTPTMTPTPEPTPEPMTILLFGTGLAGIGMAARRRFKKRQNEDQTEN